MEGGLSCNVSHMVGYSHVNEFMVKRIAILGGSREDY